MPDEYDSPSGGEFASLISLICDYQQPELEKFDPRNPLLKLKIRDIGGGIAYSQAFGKRFDGMPLNRALEGYYHLLDTEIKRIKVIGI